MANLDAKLRSRAKLLNQHPIESTGVWVVRGEDENPDLGGSHYMPILGYFEGRYMDVVDLAINLRGFFSWGAGGSISPVEIKPVTRSIINELDEVMEELDALEARKKTLKDKATKLGNTIK